MRARNSQTQARRRIHAEAGLLKLVRMIIIVITVNSSTTHKSHNLWMIARLRHCHHMHTKSYGAFNPWHAIRLSGIPIL